MMLFKRCMDLYSFSVKARNQRLFYVDISYVPDANLRYMKESICYNQLAL